MTGKLHFIHSGQMQVAENGDEIATVLGTCVALCVFDPKLRLVGMCHYLLPSEAYSGQSSKGILDNPFNFGDFAIPTLLGLFKKRGSLRSDLKVSILGGSVLSKGELASKIAFENIKCAELWIEKLGLTLDKKKTGLPEGLQIRINSVNGGILLKRIANTLQEPISSPSPRNTFALPATSFSKTEPVIIPTLKVDPSLQKIDTKIRVLIVDDSKTIRRLLRGLLEKSALIQVIGEAADAYEAETLRSKLKPDVMTLDIHMPEKDGVTYLEEILNKDPLPIVMVSDLSLKEASPVMRALELGAFDYIQKPAATQLNEVGPELINIVLTAYESRKKLRRKHLGHIHRQNQLMAKNLLPPSGIKVDPSLRLIAIGASTGGPEALRQLLGEVPELCPPIIIVQHMPALFTRTFAESLNLSCRIKVKEAQDGELLEDSTAYIAPGGFQMGIIERSNGLRIAITNDPPVNRFKPSVDYLFNSLSTLDLNGQLRAALLTGMGSDGAKGLAVLKQKGVFTIAQDEESCVVYGMPKVAIELNAVCAILPLKDLTEGLLNLRRKPLKNAL